MENTSPCPFTPPRTRCRGEGPVTPASPPKLLTSPRTPRFSEALRTTIYEQRNYDALDRVEVRLAEQSEQLSVLADAVRRKADGAEVDQLREELQTLGAARGRISTELQSIRDVVDGKADMEDLSRCALELKLHSASLDAKAEATRLNRVELKLEEVCENLIPNFSSKAEVADVAQLEKSVRRLIENLRTKADVSAFSLLQRDYKQLATSVAQKAAQSTVEEWSIHFAHKEDILVQVARLEMKLDFASKTIDTKANHVDLVELRAKHEGLFASVIPAARAVEIEARLSEIWHAMEDKTDSAHFNDAVGQLFSYYEAMSGFMLSRGLQMSRPPKGVAFHGQQRSAR